MPRVVSLLPNVTEMLCVLGHAEALVARSHACDFPASILAVPSCTEPKTALPGIGYSLGDRLKALLQEGLSPYRVDAQLLRDLRPDVIFTQYDLPFAGISVADLEAAAREWFGDAVRLVNIGIAHITDIWPAFRTIAEELGDAEAGTQASMLLQHRMAAILSQAVDCSQRPRAACIAGLTPFKAAGGFVPDLVEMAGAKFVPSVRKLKGAPANWAILHEADPDIVLVMLTGCGKIQAREAIEAFKDRAEWKDLRAVREGEVALCDAGPIMHRLGPRVVEALETIAEIVQPGEFQFGHRGHSWEPL
jgi:iron complex transport system substrate-binding protein